MKLDSRLTTIDRFLKNNKFRIPRYQREYSWGKQQLDDFYTDIVTHIKKEDNEYKTQEYFFGTIILVGEKVDNSGGYLEIIDGQQRITTITIFLSVLSNILYQYDTNLSDKLWNYIIGENVDGELYKVMENETASDYFVNRVQKRDINIEENTSEKSKYQIVDKAKIKCFEDHLSSESKTIKYAYDFFMEKLNDDDLCTEIFKNSEIDTVKKLKCVRDQLLNSSIIYISSDDINDVNTIFENINSKGLHLSSIDLIKNEIFSADNKTIPEDEAKKIWEKIKENLRNNGEYISIQKFYRYFWLSRYSNCSERTLWKEFKKTIKEKEYKSFLSQLEIASATYSQIINPKKEDFEKSPNNNNVRKEDLESLIRSLTNLQNELKIEQVQVLLLSLIDKYRKKKVKFSELKEMVNFLEDFHFIYNGILTERTNTLVNKYGKTARFIYNSDEKSEIIHAFNNLKENLIELLPKDKTEFIERVCRLTYSAKSGKRSEEQQRINRLGRYSIYKLEELLSEKYKQRFDRVAATIEHIIPESERDNPNSVLELVLNFGNLTILECILNQECADKPTKEKYKTYEESGYYLTKEFLENYETFDSTFILERSKKMAEQLYNLLNEKWKINSQQNIE